MTRRRKKRRKNPSTTTMAARSNPRRKRRKSSYRRRRNPNDVVTGVGTVIAGSAVGLGTGYISDVYASKYITNPLYRAGALVLTGLVLGGLVGRKRPDLGMALGAGIAGGGVARGAAKFLPQTASAPVSSSPKQMSGVYDNMMGAVPPQLPYAREQQQPMRSSQPFDANLSY